MTLLQLPQPVLPWLNPVGDVIPPLLAGAASLGAGSPPPVSYPPTNYGPPPMASASPPRVDAAPPPMSVSTPTGPLPQPGPT